jgi:hypothetical protein
MPEMTRTPQHGDIVMFKENDGFEVFGRTILFAGRLYADGRPVPETGVTILAAVPDNPTEEMLNAARDWSYKKYGKPIGNDAAIGCWKEIMDKALAAWDAKHPQPPTTNGGKS